MASKPSSFSPFSALKGASGFFQLMVVLGATAAILGLVYQVGIERIARKEYARRLRELASDYARLREDYNEAISRTAINALLVENNRVSIEVRSSEGFSSVIPTPFNATREIYVDYAVIDGRILIRRVFDSATSPENAFVLDARLNGLDWSVLSEKDHGKAIYRKIGEGRWAITVTGNGALGLERTGSVASAPLLKPAPPIRDYSEISSETEARISSISVMEWAGLVWQEVQSRQQSESR